MNLIDEPANPPSSSAPDWWNRAIFSFRSVHPQGVHFLMADGSARFVQKSIPHAVYQAMGSRNGGEVISNME